jgi:hypothetical protein
VLEVIVSRGLARTRPRERVRPMRGGGHELEHAAGATNDDLLVATLSPMSMPAASRTAFGIVTCPFLYTRVTLTAMSMADAVWTGER